MSRKSRRHGRHLSRSKRRKFRKGFSAPAQPSAVVPQPSAAVPQPSVAAPQKYEPAPRAEVAAPPVRAPVPRHTATQVQLPNIATELRMIGILSGTILAILIVLAFILP